MTQMTQTLCNNVTQHFFTGNLIPNSWYQSITTKTGRPDSATISILSEIVYWYRPGRAGVSKFQGDAWQTSYEHFEKKFSYNRETIRRIFVKLEKLGLAHRELRTVGKFGQRYNNVLFIHLNSQQLQLLTRSRSKKICTSDHKPHTPSPQIIGDYIEDKINPKNISRSDISNFCANKILENSNLQPSSESVLNTTACANESFVDDQGQKISQQEPNNKVEESSLRSQRNLQSDSDRSAHKNLENESYHEPMMKSLKIGSLTRKPLLSFHPLTEEDAIYLRKASGRPFTLRYINMLLLNLSVKKPDHGFYTKELLLTYMTPVLIGEKRDAHVVNNETFNFKLKSNSNEYKANQKKKYLNAIELSLDTNILTKIKRRIIGLFDEDDAYNIITNSKLSYVTEYYNRVQYIIEAPSTILEIESQKKRLTQAVRDILGQTVEVIFKEQANDKSDKLGQGLEFTSQGRELRLVNQYNNCDSTNGINTESAILSSSLLWQKIRVCLKTRYSEAIDKTWFSKLDIELNSKNNKIYVKCPTNFIMSWIKQNYISAIESVISEIGKTTKELLPDIDMNSSGYSWLECRT